MTLKSTGSLLIVLVAIYAARSPATDLTGAGSTFVYPLMAKWATRYRAESGHVVNYQSIGSGGGLKQIENQTVDFGASDMPLTGAELGRRGLTQFPVVAGAVVPVIHVRDVGDGQLNLTGEVLAAIYLKDVTRWNDPAIAKLNPGVRLPDRLITVVHRADGSGTTFIFTSYLGAVSPAWRARAGTATALTWPTGVGGKGNEGVASFVKQIDGAIGYVESAFAARARLATVNLRNSAGQFVPAAPPNFAAALNAVDWSSRPDYDVSLVNAPGRASWPITGATFVLMRTRPKDRALSRATLDFFTWAFAKGEDSARALHYVPLPPALHRRIAAEWPKRFAP